MSGRLDHEEVIIVDQIQKKTRSRKLAIKQKRSSLSGSHDLEKQVITDHEETFASDDCSCSPTKVLECSPPNAEERLPTVTSLQQYVCQELLSRYGEHVDYVDSSVLKTDLLSQIVEEKGDSAFIVTDLGTVVSQARKWKQFLPRVQPYYAVKSNPDVNILRALDILGVNFDCASAGEIDMVLDIGAEPSQIIYANPAKGFNHIMHAKKKDVRLMTFDNMAELEKIMKLYPDAELVLRIAANDSMSLLPFGFKFGASYNDAVALIGACKEMDAKLVGISFHVGSGCYSPLAFIDTLESAKELFLEAQQIGLNMSLLDIGGGFPGDDDSKISFEEIANSIAPVIDDLFSEDIHVIAEPGRYFSSACSTACLQVYAKRDYIARKLGENGEFVEIKEVQYYVPDGVYGSFNNILYDHASPICRPLKEPSLDAVLYNSTVFGPTCDSIDVLAKQIYFPSLEIGDWIYFCNMGAYTVAAGSTFNGFERPPVYYKLVNGGLRNAY